MQSKDKNKLKRGGIKKVILVIGIVVVILPLLIILLINNKNNDAYGEVVALAEELGYYEVDLGYIHSKSQTNEALVQLTEQKDLLETINNETSTIKDTINDSAINYLKNIQKITLEDLINIPSNTQGVYYLNKNINTIQYNYLTIVALVDDLNYIVTQDNFEPDISTKTTRNYVKQINTAAQKAYDEVLKGYGVIDQTEKELGDEITDKELKNIQNQRQNLKKNIKSFDFTTPLTKEEIESLKTYEMYTINPSIIEEVDSLRDDIQNLRTKINKEVSRVKEQKQKKQEKNNSKDSKVSSSTEKESESVNTPIDSEANTDNTSTSNSSNNSVSSTTNNSCGWGTDCYCKEHFSAEGWTQYYADNNDCGYPNRDEKNDNLNQAKKPYAKGYDSAFSNAIANAVNDVRAANGLSRLPYDSSIQYCADERAYNDYLNSTAHSTNDCGEDGIIVTEVVANGADIGERLQGVDDYAADIANAWSRHPGHMEVVLREDKAYQGIVASVYHSGTGSSWIYCGFRYDDQYIEDINAKPML